MSQSLEKFRSEERVRLSFHKHRGDVLAVSKELDIDLAYVQKVTKKIQKRMRRDTSLWIADTLMQQILLGHGQRCSYLKGILDKLEHREQLLVSVCHEAPVVPITSDAVGAEDTPYMCVTCGKPCRAKLMDRAFIFKLLHQTLEQLREEDRVLIDFAEKMGYTAKEPQPILKQNFLVLNDSKTPSGKSLLTTDDRRIIEDMSKLPARDRDKIARRLEKQLRGMVEAQGEVVGLPTKKEKTDGDGGG